MVIGWRFRRLITGTMSSTGRSRRTAPLPTVLMATEARASEATPRSAARRARALPPSVAMPAAAPNHSSPWLALRLNRGSTASAPGQCRSATPWNALRSRCWSQPLRRVDEVKVEGRGRVDMAQRIPGPAALNQEARGEGPSGVRPGARGGRCPCARGASGPPPRCYSAAAQVLSAEIALCTWSGRVFMSGLRFFSALSARPW